RFALALAALHWGQSYPRRPSSNVACPGALRGWNRKGRRLGVLLPPVVWPPQQCESEQRRGHHQKEAYGVEDRTRPLAHASIHHDGQRRIGSDEHQRRVEVLEGHQKRDRG